MSAPSVPQPNAAESTPKATGSGVVEDSPAHFAALNFSPDVFGYNFVAPATAPAYPQHKLFWEPSPDHNMDTEFPSIPNPFDGPTPTIMPDHPAQSTSQATSNSMVMDLSNNAMMTSSFGPSSFVSTAHQPQPSSRTATTGVDPSLLFSSPSRLPAPPSLGPDGHPRVLNEDSLQPYAYQLQEAKRDKVYAGVAKPRKRRKPSVDSPAVKAALENLRDDPGEGERPAFRRSFTESALPRMNRDFRESGPVRPDSRHGRSSPLKRIPEAKRERERERKARHRTSIALTIDANGRARAETRLVGGKPRAEPNENAMDVDGPSDDATSSTDDDEDVVMTSFAGRPGAAGAAAGPKMGRFGRAPSSALHSHTSSAASVPSHRGSLHDPLFLPHARPATAGPLHGAGAGRPFGLPPLSTGAARPTAPPPLDASDDSDAETVVSASAAGYPSAHRAEADTAQSELRKVLQGRQQAPPQHHPARQGAAVSFAPRDHGLAKLSPTTVTDPDLATPGGSSVRGGLSAGGSSSAGAGAGLGEAIRCVCGDARDDGRPMIQW